MNYAFGLWEKRCGSYFDTDWFNLHRVKSDSDHPNPTGQIITLHIPFTQEQTDTLTEGQPGPFYTKGVYSISFGQRFRNRKKCCNLTCAKTIKMLHCYRLQLENVWQQRVGTCEIAPVYHYFKLFICLYRCSFICSRTSDNRRVAVLAGIFVYKLNLMVQDGRFW